MFGVLFSGLFEFMRMTFLLHNKFRAAADVAVALVAKGRP
jgi:hypothetical protein